MKWLDRLRTTSVLIARLHEANERSDNPEVVRLSNLLLARWLSDEDRFLALSRRARARLDTGDYKGADQDGVAATMLRLDDADTWHNLGITKERLYQDSEAAECFERAIALSPDAERYVWLAVCRHWCSEDDAARSAIEIAVALDPANAQAWRWRAHLHREVDAAAAVEHAARAIALDPENATQIRRSRAIWLTRLERYAEAVADYDVLLDLEPANDDLHVARAFALEKAGDLEGALAGYAQTYALAPHDLYSAVKRIALMHRLGRTREALQVAKVEVLNRAESFEAWHVLARAQRLAGNLPEALDAIDKALALAPGSGTRQRCEKIRILATAGRRGEAKALLMETRSVCGS